MAKGKERMSADNFLEKAKAIHGDKFDYSKVNYQAALSHVIIICAVHGDFKQTPSKHVNAKQGCPKCGGTSRGCTEEFVKKAKEKFAAFPYDYSNTVYTTCDNKVKIVCKKHGEFDVTPEKHLGRGFGCHKCTGNFSLQSIAWLEYVAEQNGVFIQHALRGGEKAINLNGKVFYVDGFCEHTNTVYQFHGDWFHGNPAIYASADKHPMSQKTYGHLYQKTVEIEKLIVEAEYVLVTIWEKDWLIFCHLNKRDPQKFEKLTIADRDMRSTREKVRERAKQYYKENKVDIAAKLKEYRNRPEVKARAKERFKQRYLDDPNKLKNQWAARRLRLKQITT